MAKKKKYDHSLSKPESETRVILPIHDEPNIFTENELRISRDYAERALRAIVLLRQRISLLDKRIFLYSCKEENNNSVVVPFHRVTLPELHTLLDELHAVLDQAHTQKLPIKGEKKSTLKSISRKQSRGRRALGPHQHPRLLPQQQPKNPTPAPQLIRRAELLEV